MSKYSGKCDFFDHIDTRGVESLKRTTVYIDGIKEPISIKSYADAIPYFAHTIVYCSCNTDNIVVTLSERSWVDVVEERLLKGYLEDVLHEYHRCKRKKEEFTVEKVLERMSWCARQDVLRQIALRVIDYGEEATIEGLTLPMYQRYRDMLAAEMKKFEKKV